MTPNILVLGAKGMLGRVVFNFFKKKYPKNTWGTDRKDNNFLKLEASLSESNITSIFRTINKIDYVINCVGLIKNSNHANKLEFEIVNALFPKKISEISQKLNFKVINISTDAVFPPLSGTVCEKDIPAPKNVYGKSKLKGEINSKNVLNFRTSIIGLDPENKKGLLEWVIKNRNKPIEGFYNQSWSGCTTLQFAQLCDNIIKKNNFEFLKSKSYVYHFSPLMANKYEIIRTFLMILKNSFKIKRTKGLLITRSLYSIYSDILDIKSFNNNLEEALKKIITFEKKI